jgi:plasmid replication initiation protein
MTPPRRPEAEEQLQDEFIVLPHYGRDEMNLVEFPFASLRTKGDRRKGIIYEGWTTDKSGTRHKQRWVVSGSTTAGLPTEFDERVYVALMAITAEQDFESRKIAFSVYQVLKIMGVGMSARAYEDVEQSLARLVGVTIYAEGSFWDNDKREWVKTKRGFHILDKYWLRYREDDEQIREEEGVPAYIIWGQDIWDSFQTGYIKRLDLNFFYSLQTPLARRLYRFLDKRMQYQDRYEIDIFELSSRLGMVRYRWPADVKSKLQPSLDELIRRGFLASAETVKVRAYTRMRFTKPTAAPVSSAVQDEATARPLHGTESDAPRVAGDVLQTLIDWGLSPKVAEQLVREYSTERILEKIDYLAWVQENDPKHIARPRGWLTAAIREDFGPPDGYQTPEEREAEAAERDHWLASEETKPREQTWVERVGTMHEVPESFYTLSQDIKTLLRSRVTAPVYNTWLNDLLILQRHDEKVTIVVPSHAARDWLANKLRSKVETALIELLGEPVDVAFEVAP